MEKEFYQEMKQSLHERRAEIIKTFVANNESFKQIIESVDPKDFGDIASEDTDRKMLESMSEKDIKRMQLIESALARIEQGKYGKCIKCTKKNTGRPAGGYSLCPDVSRMPNRSRTKKTFAYIRSEVL